MMRTRKQTQERGVQTFQATGHLLLSVRVVLWGLFATSAALAQAPRLPGAVNPAVPTQQTNVVDAAQVLWPSPSSTPLTGGQKGEGGEGDKTLEGRLAQARAELAAATDLNDASLAVPPASITQEEISLRRGKLQRLVRIYEQQLSNATELETVKNQRAELVREAQAWTGFSEARPYSILLTDSLREEIQLERLKAENAEAALSVFDRLIEEHRDSLARAEENLRRLQEQSEGAQDPTARLRLSWQRELERLNSRVAAESVALFDLEQRITRERLAQSPIRLGWLQRRIVIADAGAKFTQADLDQMVERLEDERRQFEGELAQAEAGHRAALRTPEAASAELRRLQAQPDADPAVVARAAELAEVRRVQLETADAAVKALRLMLEIGSTQRTMWELRFATCESRSAETLRQSERHRERLARRISLWKDYQREQQNVASIQTALQEARVNHLDPGSDLLPLARERLAALRERDQFLLRVVRQVERSERLLQRWDEGLQAAAGKLPFAGRVRHLFSDAGFLFKKLWNFELFAQEDTITVDGQKITGQRSVTVSKIVVAVLILVVGYWITGLLSRILEPFIVKRLKIEPNQASLVRRWFRTVLVISLVVFSLTSAKIPLTVFAFAGGALAIGLGFGTQTLLKNFVSGIIILFERPFRVGDVLDVAGQRGTVTEIGLRSSVLKLWDDTETLIPNSTLLENNLTNWTYSNRTVRFSVTVGVAYGSDPRQVIQLLSEVAERHGLVEKEPKPQMLFTEFGNSALNFELRFWVDVLKANAAQVSSELRQMIAGAFAERGIVIAFPQRDVHLDTSRPLQVQMVPVSTTIPAAPEKSRNEPECPPVKRNAI